MALDGAAVRVRDHCARVLEQPQAVDLEAGREPRIALGDLVVDLEKTPLVGVRGCGESHAVLMPGDFAGHLRTTQLLIEFALPHSDAFAQDYALLVAQLPPATQPDGARG